MRIKSKTVIAQTLVAIAIFSGCTLRGASATNTLSDLLSFNGPKGASPSAPLTFDSNGNLYGTTTGGTRNEGSVFELSPTTDGQWQETVLHSFGAAGDGASPTDRVILDGMGNIFGATVVGGDSTNCPSGCGVIFELVKGSGGFFTETILYTFAGKTDGSYPHGLALDAQGNLYGTTLEGGSDRCEYGCGTIFKLTPSASGAWKKTLLHGFRGLPGDGAEPGAAMIFDAQGNLYGTTVAGGSNVGCDIFLGCGSVFELQPAANGSWNYKVLHAFAAGDVYAPAGELVFDQNGNLFGAAGGGNGQCGGPACGGIFELAPNAHGRWTESILYLFQGSPKDGRTPYGPVVVSPQGNIYVATEYGGPEGACGTFGCGTIEELTPSGSGTWTGNVLLNFSQSIGVQPVGGLIADSAGNCYGTTLAGGNSDFGVVFEFTP